MIFNSIGEMFLHHVPTYKGRGWRPFVCRFRWNSDIAEFVRSVSERRCDKRLATYVIPGELERSKGSLRFGFQKSGHGYRSQRGDFCLVGGAYEKQHLTVFYRRLEMIGGLHYDTPIFEQVERVLGRVRTVTIMAAEAKVFALRGNSNEKLYKKLVKFYAQ